MGMLDTTEAARLAALRRYEVEDMAPEPALDALTALARATFGTPTALLSLVDETRQWFKGRAGATPGEASMPRDLAFCSHTMLEPEPLVVSDTLTDERFVSHPLVTGPPHARFYAGAPLVTPEGLRIGTVCVISPEPRQGGVPEHEVAMLQAISTAAIESLETRLRLRHARRRAEEAEAEVERLRATLSLAQRRKAVEEGRHRRPGRPSVSQNIASEVEAALRAGGVQKEVAWRHNVSLSTVRRIAARLRDSGAASAGSHS